MLARKRSGPVSASTESEAQKADHVGTCGESSSQKPELRPVAIHAELIGDDTCRALGISVRSSSPVLALCRALIDAGHDPDHALDAYRGDTLCLHVRSLGEAATLSVAPHGVGFRITPHAQEDANGPPACNPS